MNLNEKTLKSGTNLYFLGIHYSKGYGTWDFEINKGIITSVEEGSVSGRQYYYVKFRTPWTNEFTPEQHHYRERAIWGDNILGNKEPTLKVKEHIGAYRNEWEFFCDSFRDLSKILKETVFSGKGNEATKRRRLKVYRELLKQWTNSWYRENFYTRIEKI